MSTASRKPPVFLDRDGTLIVEKDFLSDPRGVDLETGVIEGLRDLQDMGHLLFVVSNQSGIGRGFFTADDVRRVNQRADDLLRAQGIEITAWYFCPHAPDATCNCRKPLPGLAQIAVTEWQIEPQGSYVIGDRRSDLEFADAIGGTGILLGTGYGALHRQWARGEGRPVVERFIDAADFIRQSELGRS